MTRILVSLSQCGLAGSLPSLLLSGFSSSLQALSPSFFFGEQMIDEKKLFAFPYLVHHHHCRQVCSPPVSKRASKPSKHLRSDLPPRCSLVPLQPLLEPQGRLIKVCNNRSAELCFVVHLLALLILLLAGWQHLLHSGWAVAHLLLLILFVVHLPQHLSPRPAPRLSNVDEVILI